MIAASLAITGCSAEAPEKKGNSDGDRGAATTASASASATATAETGAAQTAASASANGEAYAFEKKLGEPNGGEMEFKYAWPAAVAAEPALVQQLGEHRDKMLKTVTQEWRDVLDDCPADAVSCRNASYSNTYEVVANLPRFLSLSNMLYTYTGGAHGMYGKDSSIWDRQTKELIAPDEFFTSLAAIEGAVRRKACAALDRERLKRRGEVLQGEAGEWPNNCPGMDETVLFVGSSNGKTFDRLGLYYGPYVAGPYAEGEFEINLPVDGAVLKAVKPEYAAYFSAKR